ncbi:MAG: MerR family transcriptional regulator [Oscillospiraceae bacterium]|jgi:DNA-binding transcriptional MerR regulator|nr:MerR family transcriptional regulator [Oscillospiraceae bacterium]
MNRELTILEFSRLTNIEPSKLRHWEATEVFTPISRDPSNNYRYYSVSQLFSLIFVTSLSTLGVPLATIAKLHKERDPELLLELFHNVERALLTKMSEINLFFMMIHARRELINVGIKVEETVISIKYFESRPMMVWPRNVYEDGDTFCSPLSTLMPAVSDMRINLNFPIGGFYDNIDSFTRERYYPNHFISIDPTGKQEQKAGEYLVGYTRGCYFDVGDLPERMAEYAKEHSLTLVGRVYIIYLLDVSCITDSSQYLAECSVEVKRK